jgi:hypothetical protein
MELERDKNEIISRLRSSIESRLIITEKQEEMKTFLFNHIRNDRNGIIYEIINLIDDYSSLISHSLQIISSLETYNVNLKESFQKDFSRLKQEYQEEEKIIEPFFENNNEKNENINYCEQDNDYIKMNYTKGISQSPIRKSLRQKMKESIIGKKIKSQDDNHKINLTNIILKDVHITQNFQNYFGTRYSDNNYFNFLENLINYKYSIEVLLQIKNDIEHCKVESIRDESFSNLEKIDITGRSEEKQTQIKNLYDVNSEKPKHCKGQIMEEENINFPNILRKYRNDYCNMDKIKKPFNRFTKLYGNFFDKKIKSSGVSPKRQQGFNKYTIKV